MTPRKAPEAVLVALAEADLKLADAVDGKEGVPPALYERLFKERCGALAAYRAAMAPLRTRDDWRPSNADPVCDPKLAKRETLEALAVALDGTWSKGEPDGGGAVKGALDAYRTECRPAPLRTRAERNAELFNVALSAIDKLEEQGWCGLVQLLREPCSEPTADEPRFANVCCDSRRNLRGRHDEHDHEPNATTDHGADLREPEPCERCGCEQVEELETRLRRIREIAAP